MIQVRRRADLKADNILIPLKMVDTGKIIHVQADEWMWASQPDELDDSEWNMLIYSDPKRHNDPRRPEQSREVIALGISIDFDFGKSEEL